MSDATCRTPPLDWLFGLEQFGIKFGLANIVTLAEELGHPQHAFLAIHIAGTNGKGSVAAMVDISLRAAGHRTGRFNSPHMVHVSERFSIDGAPVDGLALTESAARLRQTIARLISRGRLQASPTFFEVATAMAFDLFAREQVAIGIFEVGMGGRLDATNILSPGLTAITTIGLDHQRYLGHSLAEIAFEKSGIVKPGVPMITGRLPQDAAAVVREVARQRGAPLVVAWEDVRVGAVELGRASGRVELLETPAHQYQDLVVNLAGSHQIDNAVVAIRMLETLTTSGVSVPAGAIKEGLGNVSWPGRLEHRRLHDGREALLDAAHNPEGAATLASFLAAQPMGRRPLVFAASRDKDVPGILRPLAPYASAIIVAPATSPRTAEPAVVVEAARSVAPDIPVLTESTVTAALAAAWRLSSHIVVAGSIFLLGDVIKDLDRS